MSADDDMRPYTLVEDGPESLVKVAQTFRSGTSDADALDYVEMALDDAPQTRLEDTPRLHCRRARVLGYAAAVLMLS